MCPSHQKSLPVARMILNAIINENSYPIRVPDGMIKGAVDIFTRMDEDMQQGWQMSRTWVDCPDVYQRCQIVADRLLTAMENRNQELVTMMAAYIMARIPDVRELK